MSAIAATEIKYPGSAAKSLEGTEVQRVVNAFAETWNRHDIDAFADLFSENAEFVNEIGIWWEGRSEIKAEREFTHQSMFQEQSIEQRGNLSMLPHA